MIPSGHLIQRPKWRPVPAIPAGHLIQRPKLTARSSDPKWPPDPETQIRQIFKSARSSDPNWPPDPETYANRQIQWSDMATWSRDLTWPPHPVTHVGYEICKLSWPPDQKPLLATRSKDPWMRCHQIQIPSWPPDSEIHVGHQIQRPQLATRSKDPCWIPWCGGPPWPPDPETPAGHQIQRTQQVTRSRDPSWPPDPETPAGHQIRRPQLANTRSFQSSNDVTLFRQISFWYPKAFCLSHQLATDYLFFTPPDNLKVFLRRLGFAHRVLTLSPLPLHVAKAGRNHLNEEITPLLPTGDRRAI